MPLPFSLDHINLWLLRDGDEWVIVDSGLDDLVCKEVWEQIFDGFIAPELVNRIVITHYHPDHVGLAAWLAKRCNCKIHITAGELQRYRMLVERTPGVVGEDVKQFIASIGYSDQQQEHCEKFFAVDDRPASSRVHKEHCVIIKEGDLIKTGENVWRVVVGNGHSPEHACLYCESLELLISGDQALPRISSNISVYYSNADADPLRDWLDSCAKLRDSLPVDTLVLPSHQEPFFGLDLRMQQLIDDHHAQLNKLRMEISGQITANEAREILFERELSRVDVLLATGETLAHINHLWHRDELQRKQQPGSVTTYCVP
jgi:glyoxylase-like metal-dependent hydrolase (beta-lactamase superfamily II)